ncbi:hypothetical protein RLOC_00013211 [Lonchura striata]|uniref:Uncharacterized protein n=1 Tax=Lonchura striata TaxID=40157 RepID=A0A218UM72_9PASE|nr:hypothetical protein RLOC_00013211 [Lonchura striata domestica]
MTSELSRLSLARIACTSNPDMRKMAPTGMRNSNNLEPFYPTRQLFKRWYLGVVSSLFSLRLSRIPDYSASVFLLCYQNHL